MMGNETLDRLLRRDRGQFLEFISIYKRTREGATRRRKARHVAQDIARVISAFANADGGMLLVGVEEDKSVSGVDYPQPGFDTIIEAPRSLVQPALNPTAKEVVYGDKLVLKFEVAPSPVPHRFADGTYFIRTGDQDLPFPSDKIVALKEARGRIAFEQQFVREASIEDLDEELLEEFARRTDALCDPLDLLSKTYRLIDFYNDVIRITNAVLLLFAKDPVRWNPRCGVDFIICEGTEIRPYAGPKILRRTWVEGPIFSLIPRALEVIKEQIDRRFMRYNLFFMERFEYPPSVWQEALINAVAHRDYSLCGIPIQVWMFEDRLEVRSPGLLPEPVSLEQLYRREKVHFSRNPFIVRVLTDLGYMREMGLGVSNIFHEMEKNHLQPPEFRQEGFIFSVVLRSAPLFDLETQRWMERFSNYPLNVRQRRALAYARHHGMRFTSRVYQKIGNIDRDTAYREIKEMVRFGIVRPSRQRYARSYVVKDLN
ncbi:MAG TPA: hypothetical protein EYP53_10715 [Candidatus Latescibacteria bacterium]|nr:hypothetical protein [Candidatus Latescibacterota bacterium]